MNYLILDTNIYLHCKSFDCICWGEFINHEEYCFYVPMVVLDELDKQKDINKSSKLRRKAHDTCKKLMKFSKTGSKISVEIGKVTEEAMGGDKEYMSQDELLIQSALRLQQKEENATVWIVTRDYGMLLRAETKGVKVIDFTDKPEYLDTEKTDEERKAAKLEEKLNKIQKALPKPVVYLKNKISKEIQEKFCFDKSDPSNLQEKLIEKYNKEKIKYRFFIEQFKRIKKGKSGTSGSALNNLGISIEDLFKLNMEDCEEKYIAVNKYLEEYKEKYLPLYEESIRMNADFDCFCIVLKNEGHKPSGTIKIKIELIKGSIYRCDYKKYEFQHFKPPHENLFLMGSSLYLNELFTTTKDYNIMSPIKNNTYELTCNEVMHHNTEEFEKTLFWVRRTESDKIVFKYELFDSLLPDIKTGYLEVKVC